MAERGTVSRVRATPTALGGKKFRHIFNQDNAFMPRYALYFAPEPTSHWWRAGCQWLGRDAHSMLAVAQPPVAGLSQEQLHARTTDARRYGFHATLKAPFRLAEGVTRADLEAALCTFCIQQEAIEVPAPQVHWIGNFLALLPTAESPAINELAMRCVRQFSPLRAPISETEIARRQRQVLSPRQQELLRRWGYPYTEEEYRFHLTLTDYINTADDALGSALRDAAVRHFQISEVMRISSIALCIEVVPGAAFQLLRRYPLGTGHQAQQ
jgi:putative phosphonate metabolism protein